MPADPNAQKDDMKRRIFGGARVRLGSLSKAELEALHPLLVSGEAEIISVNCQPTAVRKLPKW